MAFVFKKQIFGFMDLLRFKKMVPKRRKIMAEAPATPLPATYKVNETAKILHPGYQSATLTEVRLETADMKTYVFETEKPFYFRAGQYATLGCNAGGSEVSRPYAFSSSPREALAKKAAFTVKKAGFFSEWLFDNAKPGRRLRTAPTTIRSRCSTGQRRLPISHSGAGSTPLRRKCPASSRSCT